MWRTISCGNFFLEFFPLISQPISEAWKEALALALKVVRAGSEQGKTRESQLEYHSCSMVARMIPVRTGVNKPVLYISQATS